MQQKPRIPHCPGVGTKTCGVPLPSSKSRIFKNGIWWCPDCIYRQEVNPEPEQLKRERKPKRPQDEALLDVLADEDGRSFGDWVESL